jgi:hypothetical protein
MTIIISSAGSCQAGIKLGRLRRNLKSLFLYTGSVFRRISCHDSKPLESLLRKSLLFA